MSFFKAFAVVLVIGCVFAEEEGHPEECAVEDISCYNKFKKKLPEQIAGGVLKYGVKAIGPLGPSFEMKMDGATADFKNSRVTGLKNEEIVNFRLDGPAKTMMIAFKENVKIEGDLDVKFPKKSEKYSGKYSATTEALLTATYNYELKTNSINGLQYIQILSNTFKCEPSFVNATRDEEFEKAISNGKRVFADPELKSKYTDAKIEEFHKAIVCKILENCLDILNNNFKLAAYYYPAVAL